MELNWNFAQIRKVLCELCPRVFMESFEIPKQIINSGWETVALSQSRNMEIYL